MTISTATGNARHEPWPSTEPPAAVRPLSRPYGLMTAGLAGICAVVAVGLIVARPTTSTGAWDLAVVQAWSAAHTPVLDQLALLVDGLFGPMMGGALIVLAALVVGMTTRRRDTTVTFLGVALAPWAVAEILKAIVQRDRPNPGALVDPILLEPHSFSFPSGHTAFAAGLALAFIVLARKSRWRHLALGAGIAVTLTVGAGRVWAGVHYPTDVLASAVLALSVTALLLPPWLAMLSHHERRRSQMASAAQVGTATPANDRSPL